MTAAKNPRWPKGALQTRDGAIMDLSDAQRLMLSIVDERLTEVEQIRRTAQAIQLVRAAMDKLKNTTPEE